MCVLMIRRWLLDGSFRFKRFFLFYYVRKAEILFGQYAMTSTVSKFGLEYKPSNFTVPLTRDDHADIEAMGRLCCCGGMVM